MIEHEKIMGINDGVKYQAGVYYIPKYIDNPLVIAEIKAELLGLDWLTKREARHEYFMSAVPTDYSYGNARLGAETYSSKEFTPFVQGMMNALNNEFDIELTGCFLNKYDTDQQHLGYHKDDFPGMREDQPIVVVSFGAERYIYVKENNFKGVIPDENKILLEEGSAFIMPPFYQRENLHKIPKHSAKCGWRISLTFRSFVG